MHSYVRLARLSGWRLTRLLLIAISLLLAGSVSAQNVQQLADRAAIAEQIARYSYAADGKDANAFAAVFAEDAVWKMYPAGAPEPSITLNSRTEIRKFSEDLNKQNPDARTGHHQSGLLFTELTANTATTQNMILVTQQGPKDESPHIVVSGIYYDTWIKSKTGWRIKSLTLRMQPLPLPALK